MTKIEYIDVKIAFADEENIIPGDLFINPNIFGTIIDQDIASTGTQMLLGQPDISKQLKFISSESNANETVQLHGSNDILELRPDGFAFLLYLNLGNAGQPIDRWKVIGGIKYDVLV